MQGLHLLLSDDFGVFSVEAGRSLLLTVLLCIE